MLYCSNPDDSPKRELAGEVRDSAILLTAKIKLPGGGRGQKGRRNTQGSGAKRFGAAAAHIC